MKIHKNDNVQIMTGKDRGKQGKVLRVDKDRGRILVEGINLFKKHKRPKRQGEKGEIINTPRYLNVANARVVCNACSKPTRVGHKQEGDTKIRYCKNCKASI